MNALRNRIRRVILEHLQHWRRFLWGMPSDFRPALYSLFIILVPSTPLIALTYVAPSLTDTLHSSGSMPWGLFTSIWVHYDIEHYAGNMLGTLVFIFLFAIIHEHYSNDEKIRRSKVLVWNPMLSAVVANVYTLIVLPLSSSAGASGAVFAYIGICLAYSVLNVFPSSFQLRDLRDHFLKRENRAAAVQGLGILVIFFILFSLNRVPAHLIGFVTAIALTGIYEVVHPKVTPESPPDALVSTFT